MKPPQLSESGVPPIPMNEVMSWEDWLAGRRARRETFNIALIEAAEDVGWEETVSPSIGAMLC